MKINKTKHWFSLSRPNQSTNKLYLFVIVLLVTFSSSFLIAMDASVSGGAAPQSNVQAPAINQAPDFDIRGQLANALPPAKPGDPPRATGAQAAALDSLQQQVPDLRVRWSELTGAPSRLHRRNGYLTGPSNATATDIAAGFLANNSQLLGLTASDLSEQRYLRNVESQNNGVTHLIIQQQVNGLDVFGGTIQINVVKSGEILNVSGEAMPDVHTSVNSAFAALTADEAIISAAESADIMSIKSSRSEGLVYFPFRKGDSRLSWKVVVEDADTPNSYRVLVDAMDGTLLWRQNGTKYNHVPTHGNVFDTDSPIPNNPIGPSPVAVPQVDHPFHGAGQEFPPILGSPIFGHDDDHFDWWNGSGEADRSRTVSNNAIAQDDRDGTNSSGSPVSVGGNDFSQTIDFTMEPSTYVSAAVVNLFYWTNFYHDITYSYGFTEGFSNYQKDNFGLGGLGNDPVIADAQDDAADGGGNCNANFDTNKTEGTSGRVQMYVCNSASPKLDGDFSSGTIIHELHHGLASRITSGLHGGVQGGGIGEGGGDFQDIAFLVKPGDDLNGSYGHSQYYNSNPNGNRRLPYSIRPGAYTYTYGDMGGSVHANGEIWSNALWIARASMDARYGFRAASDAIIQLQIDGYKLSPASPDFLDMRDAILQADQVDYGGANECLLWQAFARMGMGDSASSTGNDDSNPIEAFDTPIQCIPIISVAPTNMNFGLVPLNPVNSEIGSKSLDLDICNMGNAADLFLTNVVIQGEDPDSDFTVNAPNPGGFPVQISHDFCFPMQIDCDPSVAGLITGALQIESSDPLNPLITSVSLACTGSTPEIQVPSDIDFGDLCPGGTTSKVLNVCNTGNSHLAVSSISVSDPHFGVTTPLGDYPVFISPDFCFPFETTFTPDGSGDYAGVLTINSNDPDSPALAVDVVGSEGLASIDTFITDSGDFGNVCSGDLHDLNLTIQNNGTCDLQIDSVTLSGTDAADFELPDGSLAGTIIENGNSLLVPVRFAPDNFTDPNPRTASVDVASSTQGGDSFPLDQTPVQATVPPPDINLTIADSGNFGNVCKGGFVDLDLTLFNQGMCDLKIASIELVPPGGSFILPVVIDFPLILSHDADFSYPIRYAPVVCSDVPELAQVKVTSDDPDELMKFVDISGTSPCPNLVIDPTGLTGDFAFPATVSDLSGSLGCYSERTTVLRNNGLCPLTIASITASAVNEYTVQSPSIFPVILPTGEETLNVTVRFTPQSLGNPLAPDEFSGLLTIVSDDPDASGEAELCGEGVSQSGIRVLTTDISSGIPLVVGEVDNITIRSKGKGTPSPINLQFTDVVPQSVDICGNTITWHVDQETLPAVGTSGSNPKSSYEASAKEGNLQDSQSFKLDQCEFREFQLQLLDSGSDICLLLPKGASCSNAGECCSGNCKGPNGNKTCK